MKQPLNDLRQIQWKMAQKVVIKNGYKVPITCVAGIDSTYQKESMITVCAVVDFASLKIVDKKVLMAKVDFPYIPTFLSFREGPSTVKIMRSLKVQPDIFLINAQGIAHPQICGCASHVGVIAQRPTIGVATSNLCGKYLGEPEKEGESIPLYYRGKRVGWVFKSKEGCKPIFISPGHLVSLDSSLTIIKRCMGRYKLPLPLYYAHYYANEEKKKV